MINNPAMLLKSMLNELRDMKTYVKLWLKDDVRQHDDRLDEYKKQTALLRDIKNILEVRG